jgi:hypothetical protein
VDVNPDDYPGCKDAVVYHERFQANTAWLVLKLNSHKPGRVLGILRESADEILKTIPEGDLSSIRPQMDHPDFLRYITDKLK